MTEISVRTKRAYEPAAVDEGYGVLIDRFWPRGISRIYAARDDDQGNAAALAPIIRDGWPREL